MEDKKYYTILYEANYTDSGVISYKPVKIIKGYFDSEKEIFTGEDAVSYNCVNIAVPSFGNNEEHILDALTNEIENYSSEELYFAFPIDENLLLDYYRELKKEEATEENLLELYERETRGYFLYSIYDMQIGDNIFFVIDKIENSHEIINVDVTADLSLALNTGNNISNKEPLVVLAGILPMGMGLEDAEASAYTEELEREQKRETAFEEIIHDFDPDELEEKISSEVIGQDHVVKALVSMMYKNKRYYNQEGLKSNAIILGPSGCGKTEIARALSRHLNVPITIFDASSASASGYVGNSVTQAIKDLIHVCNGDIERAEHGIIVIDEIDKLASPGSDGVTKGDVQDELFKMLEGDEITIPADSVKEQAFRFNPKNVTFICLGSAQALIDKKKKSISKKSIGFNTDVKEEKTTEEEVVLEPEDLIKFGLKPELLRRLNVMKVVKQLNKDDLVEIISDSKISNFRLYERAFKEIDNVTLIADNTVFDYIAEKALKEKAGASGLKRVVDDMLETSVRKIRLLEGAAGELVLSKETVDNPDEFELYKFEGQDKILIYPPKVKTIGIKK